MKVWMIGLAGFLVASTANAQELLSERSLSLSLANEIAQTTLETCKAAGFRVTVTVLDRSGEVKVLLSNRTHTFVYSFDGQQWRWQNGQRLTKIPGQNDRMDELALTEVSAPGPQGFAGCLPANITPPAATK